MIEKMSKISMLIYHKEYEEFLVKLRNLGVMHVEVTEGEMSADNSAALSKIKHLKSITQDLESRRKEDLIEPPAVNEDEFVQNIDFLFEEANKLNQEINSLKKEKENMMPWGNFDSNSIKGIEEAGYTVQFFICEEKKWNDSIAELAEFELVNQLNDELYLFSIVRGEKISHPDLDEVKLSNPLSYYSEQIEIKKNALQKVNEQLNEISLYAKPLLNNLISKIKSKISFNRVYTNGKKVADNKLVVLTGWIPSVEQQNFSNGMDDAEVVYVIENPTPEDVMPVKLKNNRFAKLFEGIGELYTLPNHKELDLTPFFAPFYMLFFGFCLGDAGYGLLLVLGTLFGLNRAKPKLKPLLWLGFFLGISTTIMGIIGGTFFGVMFGLDANGNPKQQVEWLYNYQQFVLNTNNLMLLSLGLGYIQVIFGMVLKAVNLARVYGFKYSISQIGWIIIVAVSIPAFGLGKQEMINSSLGNTIAIISLITGGIPAILYNTPGKNILQNFGIGLWETYGMASGLLGDVLSYIRLFALGLSSGILGSVFNSLALDLSPDTIILRQLVMILILAFGHSLNVFMALLGSFVHPLRLTFVEFYKNAGFEGGGQKYEPFSTN